MIYQVESFVLDEIRLVRDNSDYKISVCRDLGSTLENDYIVLQIKNSELKKRFMECMEVEHRGHSEEKPWIKNFSYQDDICYVFPYREQRRFKSFSQSQLVDTYAWEQATLNLVVECMSSGLPYPLLYLVLNEETINISRDDSIYFTNFFKLEEFNSDIKEKDCVEKCSKLVLEMLESARLGKSKKLKSLTLIQKKVEHDAYNNFAEIYKDIKYCAVPEKKKNVFIRAINYLKERKDTAFKLLLAASVILLLVAAIMLISQLIFGDASFFKLGHEIEMIGTESMKQ